MKKLAAIGMFDGVHLGHRAMLTDLRRRAAELGMEPMAVTFTAHPLRVVRPESAPAMLMPAEVRLRELEDICGHSGDVVMLEFNPELRKLTAREFMKMLRDRYGAGGVYLGFNHRFGSDRLTNFEDYRREAESLGMVAILGDEERGPEGCRISSSDVRAALLQGDVGHAAQLLGRPYRIEGTVESGKQIGRTIGFPTANISPADSSILIPANGVYAAIVTLADGSRHRAVVNIGRRPTVGNALPVTIEAHLLDFAGNLYGADISLDFHDRLRDEQRFATLDDLRTQINLDIASARNLLR